MAERQPLIHALLADARQRALDDPATAPHAGRIDLRHIDAARLLEGGESWDVIYLDPMYPDTRKSALPSREMQMLRDLSGGDADADALLEPARRAARQRVMVKRPAHAPWLAAQKPDLSLRGTQLRFDIYFSKSESANH